MVNLSALDTEQQNERSAQIDTMSTLDMLRLINREDARVPEAVERILPEIARAVEIIYERMDAGGRLVYCGAGTSGRLGVLDAVECPPTYGVDPGRVIGLIAGGAPALIKAVEGAEDNPALGEQDLRAIGFGPGDVLVGIAASGRTPYVLGALDYAKSVGAPALALTCCKDSEMSRHADLTMAPLPGPEVITGSSRMKSGTAQKLVLNMLSTATMVKLGKVYGNLMVDVKASNEKLYQRAVRIVCTAAQVEEKEARAALESCNYSCKAAIVMLLLHIDANEAQVALDRSKGRIAKTLCEERARRDHTRPDQDVP